MKPNPRPTPALELAAAIRVMQAAATRVTVAIDGFLAWVEEVRSTPPFAPNMPASTKQETR